ncbi:MAG: hypothetical protein ACFE0Q_13410 [Anaerolineae bacterium]
MSSTQRIIYVAVGERYIQEACTSVKSLCAYMPHAHVTLSTQNLLKDHDLFDHVIQISDAHDGFRAKISAIQQSPYTETVYLDTDTFICEDLSSLYDLLETFDIAASHAPKRQLYPVEGVPDCFAELNSGVLVYKKSKAFNTFCDDWLAFYDDHLNEPQPYPNNDQPPFRATLFRSNLRLATLPPEYNCRANGPGYLSGSVKVIHKRAEATELQRIAGILNQYHGQRVHVGGDVYQHHRTVIPPRHLRPKYIGRIEPSLWRIVLKRLRNSLDKRGFLDTWQYFLLWLKGDK